MAIKAVRYQSADGRILFVSDGDSNGQEWAIYYIAHSGEVKRAAVLMPQASSEEVFAQFLLNMIALKHGFTPIQEE